MKRFIGFVIKEFYHIFRDKRSLIILFGMPVAQILLFGFAITNEINNAKIALLDKSKDSASQLLISKINASEFFEISGLINSEDEIEKIFKKGEVKAVLVINPKFAEELISTNQTTVQIIADATEPNTANTIVSYLSAIVQSYATDLNKEIPGNALIQVNSKMQYNPELKGVFMFVPGVMTIILMLVSAMMTSISIAREKELGTMEVLLVSPLNPFQVILGKVIPYILLALINSIVILSLGFFVFTMPVKGSLILLSVVTLLFILTALALGIFISTIAKTQQTAMMISLMGLMLPVILLSGFIFPVESMPLPLQIISNVVPARWFIIIIKGIMLKGIGIEILWKEILILTLMCLAFIGLGVKKYKIRLE